jgi:hypothetical protein
VWWRIDALSVGFVSPLNHRIHDSILEVDVLEIVAEQVCFDEDGPFLLIFSGRSVIEMCFGVQLTSIEPLNVNSKRMNIAVWESNDPLLTFLPVMNERCIEETRRQADQILVNTKIYLFGLRSNADVDDPSTHP